MSTRYIEIGSPLRPLGLGTVAYDERRATRYSVDGEGTVRVFDDVAQSYSVHHDLTAEAEARIRALVAAGRTTATTAEVRS